MGRADEPRRAREPRRLTSPLRRPAGAASPSRFGLPALPRAPGAWTAALLVLVAALALPAPAAAQTSVKLVGNTGQTASTNQATVSADHAQPFTTGGNPTGYKLTEVKLSVVGSTGTPTYIAQLFLAASNGQPTGSSLGTLTNPSSLATDGIKTWTAPGDGIDLQASTRYVVVLDASLPAAASPQFHMTTSDAEDANAATGWSISNDSFTRAYGSSNWREQTESLQIEIHGYPKAPSAPAAPTVRAVSGLGDRLTVRWSAQPASSAVTDYDLRWYKGASDPEDEADWVEAGESGGLDHTGTGTRATLTGLDANTAYRVQVRAVNAGGNGPWSDSGGVTTFTESDGSTQTSGALVSNTGQTRTGASALDNDFSQSFRTGSVAGGYTLTGADLQFEVDSPSGSTGASYSVEIWSVATTGNAEPDTRLGTLTNPSSLSAGLNTFTAPAGGIALDADTSYAVVVDGSSEGNRQEKLVATASNGEDAGGATGWLISNGSHVRTGGTWAPSDWEWKIAIHGRAKAVPYAPTTPTVRAVSSLGDRLTVRWRAPSVEGDGAVTDYDVRHYKGSADPEDEADWIEAGEAGGHDHVGTATKATITGLDADTAYRVQVRAVSAGGNGPWSASGVATTAAWPGASTTSGALASNTGQALLSNGTAWNIDIAQAFTTGSSAGGYKLTGLDIRMALSSGSGTPTYTVTIRANGSGNQPGAVVGTLTNPSSLPTSFSDTRFTTAGIDLDADTTYWAVIDASALGSGAPGRIAATASDGEDAGTQAGWSIADTSLGRSITVTSSWTTLAQSAVPMLAIHGYAKALPSRASPGALVGNTGQTRTGAGALDSDISQGFRTGSVAGGYTLTGADLQFEVDSPSGSTGASYSVEIWSLTSGASPPVTRLGTLTNPSSLSAGLNTFTAPAGGIALDADKYYAVVVDASNAGDRQEKLVATASNGEDAGGAAGWHILDSSRIRSGSTWTTSSWKFKIAIHGYAKVPPPAPAAPSVSGVPLQPDRLSVRWSPPAGVPATDYDLRYYRGSIDPEDEADWIEADEPGGHDHAGVLRTATVTGLLPSTTYRVQVRAVNDNGAGPWSASGSGRTEGASGASGSAAVEVLTGNFRETVTATYPLAPHDRAQGFTTDGPPLGHALGYTVTSVDLEFATAPDASVRVRLATGASTSAAGTTLATLRNPATFRGGANRFTAPAGTRLDPDTEYFVVVEGAAGELTWTRFNSHRREGRVHWKISDTSLYRDAATTGAWTSSNEKMTFRVNGRANVGDPPGAPDAPTAVPQPGTTGLVVRWFAPDDVGSGITDYDLRYFEGTADPANEADWIEEDESTGLADRFTADTSTAAAITGLRASTAYRVQVRAVSHGAPGPWSDSTSATTGVGTFWTTVGSLVGNTGQTATANPTGADSDNAQPFTTGSNAAGYRLTAVKLSVQGGSGTATYTADIFLAGSNGLPTGSSLGTLTNPSSLATSGTKTWTAPGGGIDLAAGTGYVLVLDSSAIVLSGRPRYHLTASDAEDANAASGWSIRNNSYTRATASNTWSVQANPLQIEIHGHTKRDAAPTVGALAGNTGQAGGGNLPLTLDLAQAFDTGSHASGYKLTSVQAPFQGGSGALAYTAHIFLADDVTGHPTGSSLGTLVNPASLATSGTATWTARGGGIDLSPGEGYVFVLDVSAAVSAGRPEIHSTTSDAEDAGVASGWSIADTAFRRAFASTGAWTTPTGSRSMKIAVHGYAKQSGAPTRAKLAATPAEGCVADPQNVSWGTLPVHAGALYSVSPMTDTSWCFFGADIRKAPMFMDPDGDDLAVTATIATIPDNVRFIDGTPWMDAARDRFFIGAVAAGSPTDVRVDVTAADPHGESVSTFFFAEVHPFPNSRGAPRFDEMVGVRGLARNQPIPRWVLPPANGGDMVSRNWAGQLPYFYSVSGLPPGLEFDPKTRAVTGTPTTNGAYTVTYTADDADGAYSLKATPTAADLADVARQSFVLLVGAPTIEAVWLASTPTHDSDDDGSFDTYIEGDTILVDVQFNAPVQVTGTPETPGARPRLRLDLGPSSGSRENNKVFAELLADGELTADQRLRFGYTVKGGNGQDCTTNPTTTTADCDPDGVWVQTGGGGTVVFVPAGLGIAGVRGGAPAVLSYGGLPTSGFASAKVNGGVSGASVGPRPVSAEIGGETDPENNTITVTFSRDLSPQADLSGFPLAAYFAVRGAGVVGAGQLGAYLHPNSAVVSQANRAQLVLELGVAARESDSVTLSYENVGTGVWPLKDGSSPPKRVAGFRDLAVTNNSTEVAGPVPIRASAVGTALEVLFDQRLDQDARPPGTAFTLDVSRLDGVRRTFEIAGTGAEVAIDGAKVAVTLAAAVAEGDVLRLSYAPPADSPLAAAAGAPLVEAIESYHVKGVHDSTAPKVVPHDPALDIAGTKHRIDGVVQTQFPTGSSVAPDGRSWIVLYFDEPLDPASVPAPAAFSLSGDEGAHARTMANVQSISVSGNALVMTTLVRFRLNRNYTLAYTPPAVNPLQDLAGNAVAKATWTARAFSSGKPVVRGVTVTGDEVRIAMQQVLRPTRVPPPSAFRILDAVKDSDNVYRALGGFTVTEVWLESTNLVLRLTYPVLPCSRLHPFRVSYDQPTAVTLRLQTIDGQAADSWGPEKGGANNHALATNGLASQCVRVQ